MTLFMVLEELLKGFRPEQWSVPTDNDGLTINVTQDVLGLHNRVTSPQLLLLQDIAGPVTEALFDGLSTEANHRDDVFDVSLLKLRQDMVHHGLTTYLVEDLVELGAHPRPLTSCQNNCVTFCHR